MTKATHKGTCQICGRLQKLPNNTLSKHGYTKQWGWFEGTCPGSHHKAFEESIDLINSMIKKVQELADSLNKQADKYEHNISSKNIWRRVYNRKHWRYEWVKQNLLTEIKQYSGTTDSYTVVYWDTEQGCHPNNIVSNPGKLSFKGVIANERIKYANVLREKAQQHQEYILWQKNRIKEWNPQPENLIKIN